MITDAQKVNNLIAALNLNIYSFTKRLKLSRGTVYHVIKGKNSLSENLIMRITNEFPEVNRKYLDTGELPIINIIEKAKKNIDEDGYILIRKAELKEINAKLDYLIELANKKSTQI